DLPLPSRGGTEIVHNQPRVRPGARDDPAALVDLSHPACSSLSNFRPRRALVRTHNKHYQGNLPWSRLLMTSRSPLGLSASLDSADSLRPPKLSTDLVPLAE